jgi:hypothetical protein
MQRMKTAKNGLENVFCAERPVLPEADRAAETGLARNVHFIVGPAIDTRGVVPPKPEVSDLH